jgi:hypothetical protein
MAVLSFEPDSVKKDFLALTEILQSKNRSLVHTTKDFHVIKAAVIIET